MGSRCLETQWFQILVQQSVAVRSTLVQRTQSKGCMWLETRTPGISENKCLDCPYKGSSVRESYLFHTLKMLLWGFEQCRESEVPKHFLSTGQQQKRPHRRNASFAGHGYKLHSEHTDEVNKNWQGTHRVKHHLTSVLDLYLSRRP